MCVCSGALLDSLLPLAAAAAVEPMVASDEGAARRWWSSAAVVLVDTPFASRLDPPPVRREGVVLVTGEPDPDAYRGALAVGARQVVCVPGEARVLTDLLTEAVDGRRHGLTLIVTGARGGVGASAMVAAVARQAASDGLSAVAVDADPLGGDLDELLGLADEPGLRWDDLRAVSGSVPAAPLAASLPQRHGVSLLAPTCPSDALPEPVGATAAAAVMAALARMFDLVAVDVPRWLAPSAGTMSGGHPAVAVAATADDRGVLAARRLLGTLREDGCDPRLVLRLGPRATADPRAVADAMGAPLWASVREDRRVRADLGRCDLVLRPSLRRAARAVLAGMARDAAGGDR